MFFNCRIDGYFWDCIVFSSNRLLLFKIVVNVFELSVILKILFI